MEERTRSFEELIRSDREAPRRRRMARHLSRLPREGESSTPTSRSSPTRDSTTRSSLRGVRDIPEGEHKTIALTGRHTRPTTSSRDEFFGIEKTIAQIVRYFHSASLKGEESRQVLYLMGPVGSGKSSLVEKLQRGLEEPTRSTPSRAARCSRSRCTSSRATCARSSRRCSACTSRATSARCAASA